jgi:hypothetical protein
MAESELVLRCPYCGQTFDAIPPDTWHSAHSFEEPLLSNFHGEVKLQEIICQNPKCRKTITIYWYAPMEYFNRM